ncbi:unnamed protein product [Camellia sinensis]
MAPLLMFTKGSILWATQMQYLKGQGVDLANEVLPCQARVVTHVINYHKRGMALTIINDG